MVEWEERHCKNRYLSFISRRLSRSAVSHNSAITILFLWSMVWCGTFALLSSTPKKCRRLEIRRRCVKCSMFVCVFVFVIIFVFMFLFIFLFIFYFIFLFILIFLSKRLLLTSYQLPVTQCRVCDTCQHYILLPVLSFCCWIFIVFESPGRNERILEQQHHRQILIIQILEIHVTWPWYLLLFSISFIPPLLFVLFLSSFCLLFVFFLLLFIYVSLESINCY